MLKRNWKVETLILRQANIDDDALLMVILGMRLNAVLHRDQVQIWPHDWTHLFHNIWIREFENFRLKNREISNF